MASEPGGQNWDGVLRSRLMGMRPTAGLVGAWQGDSPPAIHR
nr:hypothetical protein [Rubripirellula sp.]